MFNTQIKKKMFATLECKRLTTIFKAFVYGNICLINGDVFLGRKRRKDEMKEDDKREVAH